MLTIAADLVWLVLMPESINWILMPLLGNLKWFLKHPNVVYCKSCRNYSEIFCWNVACCCCWPQAPVAYSTYLHQIFWLAYQFMKCNQKVCVLKGTLVALLQPQGALNFLQAVQWDFQLLPRAFSTFCFLYPVTAWFGNILHAFSYCYFFCSSTSYGNK